MAPQSVLGSLGNAEIAGKRSTASDFTVTLIA